MERKKKILITGGAGFIGTNAADYFLARNHRVILFDNLSRKGSAENARWIRRKWGSRVQFVKGDVAADRKSLDAAVRKSDAVLHLAAQVAVTTSVEDPYHDFLVNACGTVNVLEAIRRSTHHPSLIYASTNKVYGNLGHAQVVRSSRGYRYADIPAIAEHHPLDFHSPYGCSKGAADQYVHDYARIYGIKTVVFRQSCIYGPHQIGVEDQGWVAWFTIAALLSRPITIYGDGHQVRDVLHCDDLSRLYDLSLRQMDRVSGNVYNIGGGPMHAFSLLSTLDLLERLLKRRVPRAFGPWRPGDQKVYVSDISKIQQDLGWEPKIGFKKGLRSLIRWVKGEERLIKRLTG